MKSKAPKDPPGWTDLSRRLSLPLLWPQQDQSYLILEVTWTFCNLRKFVGTLLRSTSYRNQDLWLLLGSAWTYKAQTLTMQTSQLTKPCQNIQYLQCPQSHHQYQVRSWLLLLRMFHEKTALLPPESPSQLAASSWFRRSPLWYQWWWQIARDTDSDPVPQCSGPTLSANAQHVTDFVTYIN